VSEKNDKNAKRSRNIDFEVTSEIAQTAFSKGRFPMKCVFSSQNAFSIHKLPRLVLLINHTCSLECGMLYRFILSNTAERAGKLSKELTHVLFCSHALRFCYWSVGRVHSLEQHRLQICKQGYVAEMRLGLKFIKRKSMYSQSQS